MFIRRTRTRRTDTGQDYFTYRLVRAEREGKKVRQRTLLNLGSHYDIDRTHWPTLCARIEQLLSGQADLLDPDCPAALEREAQRVAAQLLARAPASPATRAPAEELHSVAVDSLALLRPRSVGVEAVGLWGLTTIGRAGLAGTAGLDRAATGRRAGVDYRPPGGAGVGTRHPCLAGSAQCPGRVAGGGL